MEPAPQKKKSEVEEVGGIFGITVVVVLLALGGIYFLIMQHQKIEVQKQQTQAQANS